MMKESEGTDTMKKIALHVRKGAMAYLKQQYKIVGLVFVRITSYNVCYTKLLRVKIVFLAAGRYI